MSEEKTDSKEKFKFLKNWSFFKKLKQVKHIGLIITIIFLIILALILFGDFKFSFTNFGGNENSEGLSVSSTNQIYISNIEYAKMMEDKLKNLIGKIDGITDVEIMVSVSGGQVIIASNDETKTTKNTKGEETTTVSASPVIIQQNGDNNPLVIGEISPEIKGVVVVSKCAKDVKIKLSIINVIQTLLDVDESKIVILS